MENYEKKIEKMVEELFQYYDDIDCAVTVDQRITAKEQAELWLKRTLTQAHQAGRDEAVEIVKSMKWKGEPPESANDITWAVHKERNQALDDTIKALQDNK